jgi:serine/threonine protein kinase
MQNYIPMPPGTLLKQNRYRIKQFLTAGGFGATYTAEDTLFNNLVVVVKESFDQSPGAKEQFETEATILRSLTHDHLVRVTDAFIEPTGKMYLVMEYVEGEDLEDILARSPGGLPEPQVLDWFDQALDALAYCHRSRVVHRDIKPANIRLRPDGKTIKVLDFGIAKIGGLSVRTRDAARGVTDGYSPPEQYSRGTDTYSDVYALGATLYTLLTGRVPPVSLDIQSAGAVLLPPRQLNPKIAAGTEQVILAAMNLLPAHRYQTAGEVRQALALVRQGKPPTVPVTITCPHCGAAARASAKFCQVCGKSLIPVQPLAFPKSRHRATSVAELVHGCDSYWDEARDLLSRGEIERWLNQLGERDLAQQAGTLRARFPADPSAALEEFLEVADPNRSRPILTPSPAQLDFGRLRKGDTKGLALTVANTGRGYLYGAVTAQPAGWLTVRPATMGCLAGQQRPIQVEVNTAGLSGDERGTEFGGAVTVQSNRGAQTVPVKVVVIDDPDPVVTPDKLDFDTVPFGRLVVQPVSVSNAGGGTLQGTVSSLNEWIVLLDANGQPLTAGSPSLALKRGHSTVVHIGVDSGKVPTRGQQTGSIQIEAPAARKPVVAVPISVTVDLPFLLEPADPGSAIRDRTGLWQWCDTHWEAARGHLISSRLEACLRFMGEVGLAQGASRCRQMPDPNISLETLLRACGAPAPTKWETNALDIEGDLGYGFLPKIGKKPDSLAFKILNKSPRGYLHGYLEAVASWLSIPKPGFGCRPGEIAEVEIHADHKAQPRKLLSMGEQLFDIVID